QLQRNRTSITEPSYLTDAFTREGVSFINRHAAETFFLFMSYNAPHDPYSQPPRFTPTESQTSPIQRAECMRQWLRRWMKGLGSCCKRSKHRTFLIRRSLFF